MFLAVDSLMLETIQIAQMGVERRVPATLSLRSLRETSCLLEANLY
jgi:hypothetical protein